MLRRLVWPCFHYGERCAEASHPEVFFKTSWVMFALLPVTEVAKLSEKTVVFGEHGRGQGYKIQERVKLFGH